MHTEDQTPVRIAIGFQVQGAGCQLDPLGGGHFWYAELVPGLEARWKGRGEHVEQITQLSLRQLPAD